MVDVFLDTDVAFDLISKRDPYFADALPLLEMVSRQQITFHISEASLATLMYLSFDIYKLPRANERLTAFVNTCSVLSGGKTEFIRAMESEFTDKEDAYQYYTALRHNCDYFISRNTRDYTRAITRLPVLTPAAFIEMTSRKRDI